MSGGIVFKQRYKPVNVKSTPILNGKHLIYIATRKGAIHNRDCSFGLFGRLPSMTAAEDINNLDWAVTEIRSVSRRRTVYRAVLSVDGAAAKEHDLYSRETWQKLVTEKIGVIAEEMDIAREDFCWAASMHYAKGHPHVHIMYWDNGGGVRMEHIPEKRFEIMAEHIRAEFGREIFREEIQSRRGAAKEAVEAARLELSALCVENNLKEALNLNNVSALKLDAVGQMLYGLILDCPRKGSLKYAYLPYAYKDKVNTLIDEVMKITDFGRLQKRYLKLTDEISAFYGNSGEKTEYNREQAKKKLYTALGNDVMNFIRGYTKELENISPKEYGEMEAAIRGDAYAVFAGSANYVALEKLFPQRRTPMKEILTDEFMWKKKAVILEAMEDVRVRAKLGLWRDTNSALFRILSGIVMEKLQTDAGYEEQYRADMATNFLISMFGSFSQMTNRQGSRSRLERSKSRDLSKTALQDLRRRRKQERGLELEE